MISIPSMSAALSGSPGVLTPEEEEKRARAKQHEFQRLVQSQLRARWNEKLHWNQHLAQRSAELAAAHRRNVSIDDHQAEESARSTESDRVGERGQTRPQAGASRTASPAISPKAQPSDGMTRLASQLGNATWEAAQQRPSPRAPAQHAAIGRTHSEPERNDAAWSEGSLQSQLEAIRDMARGLAAAPSDAAFDELRRRLQALCVAAASNPKAKAIDPQEQRRATGTIDYIAGLCEDLPVAPDQKSGLLKTLDKTRLALAKDASASDANAPHQPTPAAPEHSLYGTSLQRLDQLAAAIAAMVTTQAPARARALQGNIDGLDMHSLRKLRGSLSDAQIAAIDEKFDALERGIRSLNTRAGQKEALLLALAREERHWQGRKAAHGQAELETLDQQRESERVKEQTLPLVTIQKI